MEHPPIAVQIWDKKYRFKDVHGNPYDKKVKDTWHRIALALAEAEEEHRQQYFSEVFFQALRDYKFLPAGRIIAGAGTGRQVTLFNCYVMGTIPDSMDGIFSMLREAALTMQQGGGIGYDFSTIRPKGAEVKGVAADASGPLTFMDVWDSMCRTVMSAGERRGAMMATMRCDHPDIEDFIEAKRDAARLRMFNVSVLVTDDFMDAVRRNAEWDLWFKHKDGTEQVYKTVNARQLWNKIIKATYDVAEPGVIFIDRINNLNNLNYAETIAATNPCVPGDTPILTLEGYQPIQDLVDQETIIWNGKEWESVTPFSTGYNPLVRVTLSNGQELVCTPAHNFVLEDGTKVPADELIEGIALLKPEHEGFQGNGSLDNAYSQGFYSGDGTKNSKKSWVYSTKYSVIPHLCGSVAENEHPQRKFRVWSHGQMLAKDFVPINESLATRLEWLAGLLDADGTLAVAANGAPSLQLTSMDQEFMSRVQLFLTGLGVSAHLGIERHKEAAWSRAHKAARISISTPGVAKLQELGLKTYRLKLPEDYPVHNRARKLRVVSVEDLGTYEETFCFTSKETGMGVFNGILTGQCGEQPLPPYGACLLGSINLARLIDGAFTKSAHLDLDQLDELVASAVRMMDNVVDVSLFPVPQQQEEARAKRRIGLGVTGVADALAMCQIRYGTAEAASVLEEWMEAIALSAYQASIEIAKEKGPYPLFDADGFLGKGTFAAERLPLEMQDEIREHGIRNALLTSIAPTGTISLYAGNVSSGIEPMFDYGYTRKILNADGTKREEQVVDYAVALFRDMFGASVKLPDYFTTAQKLKPSEHLRMQAAAQKWVDSSISKTINCPEDISFEDFRDVYEEAYDLGCKGCTTYRPNDVTGSVLSVSEEKPKATTEPGRTTRIDESGERPKVLSGETYKLKWPNEPHAFYVTFTDHVDVEAGTRRPYEIFINSKNVDHFQWTVALTRMVSAVFRRGGNVSFVAKELREVFDPKGGAFMGGRYVPSLLAAIGDIVAEHMTSIGYGDFREGGVVEQKPSFVGIGGTNAIMPPRHQCKDCGSYNLKKEAGCEVCMDCGSSKCG